MAVMAAAAVAQTALQFMQASKQAKYQKKMQRYRNGMLNIANAMNQNSITTNTSLQIQQSAKQAVAVRKGELSTLGSASVAAAAAGVRGNSVNSTLVNLQRNAGLMEKQRKDDLDQYFLQTRQQRMQSTLSAVQGTDVSYIPKPSLGAYILKGGMRAYSDYQGG